MAFLPPSLVLSIELARDRRTFVAAFGQWLAILSMILSSACSQGSSAPPGPSSSAVADKGVAPGAAAAQAASGNLSIVTLGAGCFWCTQAVLQRVDGIKDVVCGYMGGHTLNPTYDDVCTHTTGYAEVVQVKFDPKIITFEQVLDWFWKLHDPTTLNRQGADVGDSYRSVIFYYDEGQHLAALESMGEAQKKLTSPIVTQIVPAMSFYKAEDLHQNFFNANSSNPYCQAVIVPKLDHLNLPDKPQAKK